MELEDSLLLSQELANSLYSEPDLSSPCTHPTPWSSILILYSHLCLGLPSDLFLSRFPTKNLYTSVLSPIRATCSAHFILLYLTTRIIFGDEYRSLSSSMCSLLHSPVTLSLLDPNILLFSNTFSLCSSLNVRDQVRRPYKTTGKIIALYISIFKFLDSQLEVRRFCTERQQGFPDFNPLVTSSGIEF